MCWGRLVFRWIIRWIRLPIRILFLRVPVPIVLLWLAGVKVFDLYLGLGEFRDWYELNTGQRAIKTPKEDLSPFKGV